MEGLPLDVIHNALCPYLTVQDLCTMMQCNEKCFNTFIHDRAFGWIKSRILFHIPQFASVFDSYPWKYGERTAALGKSKSKKRRKMWVMPRGGTWYVLKSLLRHMYTISGLKKVSKYASMISHPLLLHGLRFAFDLPLDAIVDYACENAEQNYHFKCRYVVKNNHMVAICLFLRDGLLSIGEGVNRAHITKAHMHRYITTMFEFDRMRALIMGERRIPVYVNVLKDFINALP